MLGTIAINISMNAMDFSLDKIHEFLLRIRFEISIPVHVVSVQLNRIDFNVMFVMNSDNIWTLCISQTVGIWEWMTLRCAKRFRKDAEQWIKMMMKHETLNRTKYSLWINRRVQYSFQTVFFCLLNFIWIQRNIKSFNSRLKFSMTLFVTCTIDSMKWIPWNWSKCWFMSWTLFFLSSLNSFLPFCSDYIVLHDGLIWWWLLLFAIHNSHFVLLCIQYFKHFISAMVTWYSFSW